MNNADIFFIICKNKSCPLLPRTKIKFYLTPEEKNERKKRRNFDNNNTAKYKRL